VVGVVLTEEFAAALDALVIVRPRRDVIVAQARAMYASLSLGLGRRRRWFLYDPPPGWWGVPSGLVANWYPPDYPSVPINLVVFPAAPHAVSPDLDADPQLGAEIVDGMDLVGPIACEARTTRSGLDGRHYRLRGRHRAGLVQREVMVFYETPYLYSVRTETADLGRIEEASALLGRVADSIEALGRSLGSPYRRDAGVLDHWTE
jgi:hypothetical protein